MNRWIIELAAAFLGSLGLGILFYLRKQLLLPAAIGGLGNRIVFLVVWYRLGSVGVAYLTASVITALYTEIMARILKVPTTVLLLPAVATSVPGRLLFYTMGSMAWGQVEQMKQYALQTGKYALIIAGGISIVGAMFSIIRNLQEEYQRHKNI